MALKTSLIVAAALTVLTGIICCSRAVEVPPGSSAPQGQAAASVKFKAAGPVDYHVGPRQTYAKLVDVPWEKLNPGDTVYIHWRSAQDGGDYHEKINLTRSGAPGKPIRIVGVKGPHGERPCLNGKDAITRTIDPEGNSTFY